MSESEQRDITHLLNKNTKREECIKLVQEMLNKREATTLGGPDQAAEKIVESMAYFGVFATGGTIDKTSFEFTGGQTLNRSERNTVWSVFEEIGIIKEATDIDQIKGLPKRYYLQDGLIEMLANPDNGYLTEE